MIYFKILQQKKNEGEWNKNGKMLKIVEAGWSVHGSSLHFFRYVFC